MEELLLFPIRILENLSYVYTFTLLTVRYTGMLMMMPGLSQGQRGILVRIPAIMVMAYASLFSGQMAPMPKDCLDMGLGIFSEAMFGTLLGFIPAMLMSGIQLAGHLSSTTMGLGAAQLMDPTLGIQTTSLGRLMADTMTVIFLLLGGHYVIIYAAAGLGGTIIPGTFLITDSTIKLLMDKSAEIFLLGVMISSPVIVALLLTQFVMGLISKAVPTVNIFIVSFPLTIGIGLVLTGLTFPEMASFMNSYWNSMESSIMQLVVDMQTINS